MPKSPEQPMSYDQWFASLNSDKQREVLNALRRALEQLNEIPSQVVSQYGVSKEGLENLISDLEKGQGK